MENKGEDMKIETVSVLEMIDDGVTGMTSFKENAEGNKEAVKLFKDCIKGCIKGYAKKDEFDFFVNEGYFSFDGEFNYEVFLIHST